MVFNISNISLKIYCSLGLVQTQHPWEGARTGATSAWCELEGEALGTTSMGSCLRPGPQLRGRDVGPEGPR